MKDALAHHRTAGSTALPRCRARHPHLGWFDPAGCQATVRAMVLGASNQWFGLLAKALYIPDTGSELVGLVDKHWAVLRKVTSAAVLDFAVETDQRLAEVRDKDRAEVWAEIDHRRAVEGQVPVEPLDLTAREYEALCDPSRALRRDPDFTADIIAVPPAWRQLVERVVRVTGSERAGLVGFTRIDAPEWGDVDVSQRAPLVRGDRPAGCPPPPLTAKACSSVSGPRSSPAGRMSLGAAPTCGAALRAHCRWRENRDLPGASRGPLAWRPVPAAAHPVAPARPGDRLGVRVLVGEHQRARVRRTRGATRRASCSTRLPATVRVPSVASCASLH